MRLTRVTEVPDGSDSWNWIADSSLTRLSRSASSLSQALADLVDERAHDQRAEGLPRFGGAPAQREVPGPEGRGCVRDCPVRLVDDGGGNRRVRLAEVDPHLCSGAQPIEGECVAFDDLDSPLNRHARRRSVSRCRPNYSRQAILTAFVKRLRSSGVAGEPSRMASRCASRIIPSRMGCGQISTIAAAIA